MRDFLLCRTGPVVVSFSIAKTSCCTFLERAGGIIGFFMVLCELGMLNKVLQHLVSLLLDATHKVVVVLDLGQ